MKILIVSDTHGHDNNFSRVIRTVPFFDYLIHCGDVEGSEDFIRASVDCPATIVRGNNDFYTDLPSEEVLSFGEWRLFVTHGHLMSVSWSTEVISETAAERGCQIAVYGHTHRPTIERAANGVMLLNPGSLSYPRQEGRKPSYMILEIDRKGNPHYTINYL